MIRKGTWIVLFVFAVLLGLAFYLNKNPLPSETSATPTATAVPPLLEGWNEAEIVSIEYKGDPGAVTLTQNPDGSWTLGPDNPRPAAIDKVESLRTSLASLQVQSILNTTDPLDAVGLAAPTRVLLVHSSAGKQSEIRIGNLSPTGSSYYVQVDNQTPVVVSKYSLDGVLSVLSPEMLAAPTPTVQPVTTPKVDVTPAP